MIVTWVAALFWLAAAPPARVAAQADTGQSVRHIDGRVMRGTPKGLTPVGGLRVTLHRVGPDKAGPLDSTLTRANGSYAFTYRPFGSGDAVYFVSASYGGIAYFSQPTRGDGDARGDAAAINVFDTTSGPVRIRLAGHHVVVSAPGDDGTRDIAEVYDLANDTSVTLVSRGGTAPVWLSHLPPGAANVRVNPSTDIAPGAVKFDKDSVLLFAPLSPGIRQLSFVYTLPRDAFPLVIPMEQPAAVLEILAEEPKLAVSAARLREVASVSADKRVFRRFLAEDVPAGTVLTVTPGRAEFSRREYIEIVAAVFGAAMLVALAVAFRRRSRAKVVSVGETTAAIAPDESQVLLREIAALDARLERAADLDEASQARHREERKALKSRLAATLAAGRRSE